MWFDCNEGMFILLWFSDDKRIKNTYGNENPENILFNRNKQKKFTKLYTYTYGVSSRALNAESAFFTAISFRAFIAFNRFHNCHVR